MDKIFLLDYHKSLARFTLLFRHNFTRIESNKICVCVCVGGGGGGAALAFGPEKFDQKIFVFFDLKSPRWP